MKLKICVKRIKNEKGEPLVSFPKLVRKGDWVELSSARAISLNAPQAGTLKGHDVKHRDVVSTVTNIPLGVCVMLPKGFEAVIIARHSTAKNMGIIFANGMTIINQSNDEEWSVPVMPIRKTTIDANARICKFRIQLSQKASVWNKIKWMLTSGIEFQELAGVNDPVKLS